MEQRQIMRLVMRGISSLSLALFTAGVFYYSSEALLNFILRVLGV